MDTGAKTLAQLAEEGKEKKYVTLDTAAKISGYTKDYLERLCRLNKIEYRLWSNGNFVLELESLLRETQAILLSYEGISFVEKSELTDPAPQIVGSILSDALKSIDTTTASFQSPPKPAIEGAIPLFQSTIAKDPSAFSFVGRAVVSDALHPEEKEAKNVIAPATQEKKEASKGITGIAPSPKAEEKKAEITSTKENEASIPSAVPKKLDIAAISTGASEASPIKTVAEKVREHIPIQAVNTPRDEWDAQLFGETQEVASQSSTHVPVLKETAQEAPLPSPSTPPEPPVHLAIEKEKAGSSEPLPSPQKQKVIVFTDVATTKKAEEKPPVQSLPHIASTEPIPPPSTAPLPMLTHTPELTLPTDARPVPAPSNLPMRNEEHHLATYHAHPLMRSGGFNVVFAALLIVSSLTLFGGKLLIDLGGKNSLDYIAGVGAAGTSESVTKDERTVAAESGAQAALPFSSELATSTGKSADSLIVRPVFESGPGKSYEYRLVPADSSSSTPSDTE